MRTREARSKSIAARVTPTVFAAVQDAAEEHGLTPSGYAGDAIAAAVRADASVVHASPDADPLRPLVTTLNGLATQLARIGNNLNQVTRATHLGTALTADAEEVLAAVRDSQLHVHGVLDSVHDEITGHAAESPDPIDTSSAAPTPADRTTA
ncbi:MobC family plasmid mobilization relaxosome protein [Yinghuangia sp. ASG 101]|uniref:MobC family plasmid mobilization relaxosome protein n=1 Tax=Yinghuangia sp. ASG 101 TaxID=2896848 RepID=UPI001E2FA7D3|nr:MobC family plasmid mobilization relaxosome protein [Yinghuangia sp. ASG 101]UGQ14333.1 MobC family plasmid mobilization relaxosome protein [Yinghuangia sp. ASG 101]